MKTYTITAVSELFDVVKELLVLLEKQKSSTAFVLALHGDLGAGKTAFMQTLASVLGVEEAVTSPTFVLMKKYHTKHDRFTTLVHIDAYRIEAVDEMRPLRFQDELAQKSTMIGIEWAEKIASLLPDNAIHIHFNIKKGGEREITIDGKEI